MKNIVIIFMAMLIIMSCHQPDTISKREQIKRAGVSGVHQLRRIIPVDEMTGKIKGHFFLGGGDISGEIFSGKQLQFYWGRNENERIATTMPYRMFLFIIDSTKTVPTVEFIFKESYLDQGDWKGRDGRDMDYNPNPNSWLYNNENLQQAIVRISKSDLEKEIYLPK